MAQPDFNNSPLIPAIVQNQESGRVLMLAYMNLEAYNLTLESGICHFWSRSRNKLWKKGSTSGNYLSVRKIEIDCDSDSILVLVQPVGPACHNGTESCFDTQEIELSDWNAVL
jgi:phosphoribosyl-ATP pyrophosphohydrolase/phosphoribosyl-AMP cyclohydrolase